MCILTIIDPDLCISGSEISYDMLKPLQKGKTKRSTILALFGVLIVSSFKFFFRTKTSSHISVTSSLYISPLVEKFGVERFRSNIKKVLKSSFAGSLEFIFDCSHVRLCNTPLIDVFL